MVFTNKQLFKRIENYFTYSFICHESLLVNEPHLESPNSGNETITLLTNLHKLVHYILTTSTYEVHDIDNVTIHDVLNFYACFLNQSYHN